jgi:hypothetical protein
LRTEDLCYIDKDGIVFVVDRLKELIKYKGYQVTTNHYALDYSTTISCPNSPSVTDLQCQHGFSPDGICLMQVPPAELESLLQTHPDIDEAAVVP